MPDPSDPVLADPTCLAALVAYGVLDTPAEADFDDTTRLVAKVCGVPVDLVGYRRGAFCATELAYIIETLGIPGVPVGSVKIRYVGLVSPVNMTGINTILSLATAGLYPTTFGWQTQLPPGIPHVGEILDGPGAIGLYPQVPTPRPHQFLQRLPDVGRPPERGGRPRLHLGAPGRRQPGERPGADPGRPRLQQRGVQVDLQHERIIMTNWTRETIVARQKVRCRRDRMRSAVWVLPPLWAVAGCAIGDDRPPPRDPPYRWGLWNRSSRKLSFDTVVTYRYRGNEFQAVAGGSFPGGQGTESPGRDPIPDVVHVHVRSVEVNRADLAPSSTVSDVDLPVHGRVPDEAHFTGTLWVAVGDDGVKLVPETAASADARWSAEAAVGEKWMSRGDPQSAPDLGPDGVWRTGGSQPVTLNPDGTYDKR